MKFSNGYLKKVVGKRIIDLILLNFIIFIFSYGFLLTVAEKGTGTLNYSLYGWTIDPDNGEPVAINNPQYFEHILIPENLGRKVIYSYMWAPIGIQPAVYWGWVPKPVNLLFMDLTTAFFEKMIILCSFIAFLSVGGFKYFFLNRNKIQITNKLLN